MASPANAPRTSDEAYVAELVKSGDPDRWLSALFARPAARRAMLALAAFDLEIARVRGAVTQPLAGEIRLQWWRDRLEALGAGVEAAEHPVLAELQITTAAHRLPIQPLLSLIDARVFDLYDDPMPSMADFEGYAGETTSAVMRLSALTLDSEAGRASADLAGHAGVAVALAHALRNFPLDARRGHVLLPLDAFTRHGVTREDIVAGREGPGLQAALADLRDAAMRHTSRAAALLRAAPPAQRAPYLPLALVPATLSLLTKQSAAPFAARPSLSPLGRLSRLAWTYRTGRVAGLRAETPSIG